MIILAGLLLVVRFFWFVEETNLNEESIKCVKIQTTCCPCNMGGEEQCVLVSEAEDYSANLSECSENGICVAMFNCKIESCEYVDGGCVEG